MQQCNNSCNKQQRSDLVHKSLKADYYSYGVLDLNFSTGQQPTATAPLFCQRRRQSFPRTLSHVTSIFFLSTNTICSDLAHQSKMITTTIPNHAIIIPRPKPAILLAPAPTSKASSIYEWGRSYSRLQAQNGYCNYPTSQLDLFNLLTPPSKGFVR
jgi:hypothetical protein